MLDVSIVVVSYNSSIDKTLYTIKSIVSQKNISFEIIVADDGSDNNNFEDIIRFFKKEKFESYLMIDHKINQGTVKNVYDAVLKSKAKYIKVLGPGDALYNELTLYNWICALEKSSKKWSFGDSIYFKNLNEKKEFISYHARPQIVKPYLSNNETKCIWNYLVLNDIAIGANIIYEKSLFITYLELFLEKIIYLEDAVCWLMMYDGEVAYYYDKPVIYYEFGDGVSTGKNKKWIKIIADEKKEVSRIMISRTNNYSNLQKRINKIYKKRLIYGEKRLGRFFEKGRILFLLHFYFLPRMTVIPNKKSI